MKYLQKNRLREEKYEVNDSTPSDIVATDEYFCNWDAFLSKDLDTSHFYFNSF